VLFASPPAPPHSRARYRYLADVARWGLVESLPVREPWRPLYEMLPSFVSRPAKSLRPVLCLAACGAFGGTVEEALPVAVAFELIHNAFLVHDDIEDDSDTRRGGPSLHAEHGVPLALNAGDALSTLAMDSVVVGAQELGGRLGLAVVAEFERLVLETVEGQAIELGWERDGTTDLSVGDYLGMIMKKTSWYTAIQPVRIGALIGSRGSVDPDFGIRFGYHLGAMFQIANDLAGLLGDGREGGTPAGADLVEGKRTLMVIHALSRVDGADRDRMAKFLRLERWQRSPDEVTWLLELMHRVGSVDYGRHCVRSMADAAYTEGAAAFGHLPPSDDRDLLLGVVPELLRISGPYF
jgi:geranylgeranyl diphosphate synthase type II